MDILVAEDDAVSRQIVARLLEQMGYRPILCENGQSAWEKYQIHRPAICLIDWEMPLLNGIELCRRIESNASSSLCQKIMFTARDEKEDLLEAMQAGANDYLVKPVDANQLRLRLRVAELKLKVPA